MEHKKIPLDSLLLDPNNYRIQDHDGYSKIEEDRYHLDRVQNGTIQKINKENIKPLRDSIVYNGFLEIEKIVVAPYKHDEKYYVVIEGNRRVAALRQIRNEYETGIDIPSKVVEVFDSVPCLVANGEGQDPFFREAIMGIRHVGGIKEWGGYQSAKLIANLRDLHNLDSQNVAQRLGLSVQEANRRYRAYKSLQQMITDDTYAEYAVPSLYPLFHEAVSLPAIREWLGWNASTNQFENDESREVFYQLISPRDVGTNELKTPKIRTYSEVRQLKNILPDGDAKAELFQMDREFVDALAIAHRGTMATRWRNQVAEARTALSNIPGKDIENMSADEVESIGELVKTAEHVLQMQKRLTVAK